MFSKTKRLKPAAIIPPPPPKYQKHRVCDHFISFGTPGNDMERHVPLVRCMKNTAEISFPGAFVHISSPLVNGESHLSNFHFYPLENNTISSLRVTL